MLNTQSVHWDDSINKGTLRCECDLRPDSLDEWQSSQFWLRIDSGNHGPETAAQLYV